MRRLGWGAIGLAMLIGMGGCGGDQAGSATAVKAEPPKDDPASSRLAVGSEAIVRVPMSNAPGAVVYDKTPLFGPHDKILTMLDAGVRVKILQDDGKPFFSPLPPNDTDGEVDRRRVVVELIEGEEREMTGNLPRNLLRPSK